MINITEIRSGNIINDEDGFPMYFDYATPSKYGYRYADSAGNRGLLKKCNPVPLTEEWLLKLGFTLAAESEFYKNFKLPNNLYISMAKQDMAIGWKDNAGQFYIGDNHTDIPSVHMLQNYSFFVYRIELEINP